MGRDERFEIFRHGRRLRVGECTVDLSLNEIERDGELQRLTPKVAAVLEVLVFMAGQPVSRERLLAEVWRGESPTDDVVTHAIGELRRAFGDDVRNPTYIRTLPRVGYALVATIAPQDEGGAHEDGEAPTVPASSPTPRRAPWPALLALLALPPVLALLAQRGTPQATQDAPLEVVPVTSLPGGESMPSLSPDGSLVAYAANPAGGAMHVYVQVVGGGEPRRLSTAPAFEELAPVFSPDGRRIVFQRRLEGGGCRLVVAQTLGGEEREVGECLGSLVTHVSWTPDGESLLLPIVRPVAGDAEPVASLYLLDLGSGELRPMDYARDPDQADVQARYSPDGQWLAVRRGALPHSDLYLMRADGTGLRRLTRFEALMPGFDWAPDSAALVFSSNHDGPLKLFRITLEGALTDLRVERALWVSAADLRDTVVFMRDESPLAVAEVMLDGSRDELPRAVSPSSRMDTTGSYSPDGRLVAMISERSGAPGIYVVGAGGTRRVSEHRNVQLSELAWSEDGRYLVYVVRGRGSRLMRAEVSSGRVEDITPQGHTVLDAALAADGTLVFSGNSHGRFELWMQRAGEAPRQLTTEGGRHPRIAGPGEVAFVDGTEYGRLQLLDLASGAIEGLDVEVGYWNARAWSVGRERIFLLDRREAFGVHRRARGGGEWQLVEPLEETSVGELHLSVDEAGGRALITWAPSWQSDIWRVDGALARGPARKTERKQ